MQTSVKRKCIVLESNVSAYVYLDEHTYLEISYLRLHLHFYLHQFN